MHSHCSPRCRLIGSHPEHAIRRLDPVASAPPRNEGACEGSVEEIDRHRVVQHPALANERNLEVMRWGLVQYWAKDIKVGFANINAKADG